MIKPAELSSLFSNDHFLKYPIIEIPQSFRDERGLISNIADGNLGDVAVITSIAKSIRANHYHEDDWHLSFLLSGRMIYSWKSLDSSDKGEIEVSASSLFYTPQRTVHRMYFLEESTFIAVSKLNRNQENYELDTKRVGSDFFDK
jgi:dTDP-4-dehydrorhamnose 3,5-epimerase-like enzyme